jgi:hypothetical protein
MMLPYPGDSIKDFQADLDFLEKVGQLHEQITAQTGVASGFLSYVRNTIIFAGDRLAEQLEAGEFPGTVIVREPISGLNIVLSPSAEITPEKVEHYQAKVAELVQFTPLAAQRVTSYLSQNAETFTSSSPTDAQGVIKIGDRS